MNTKMYSVLSSIILVVLFLSSCSTPIAQPTATPTSQPTATSIPPTPMLAQPALVIKPGSIAGMVDIGGRSLYVICLGEGSPVVIFEAGWGGDYSNWSKALAEVSNYTQACVYDRAGLGHSDPATEFPRTSQDMVNDLHALLTKAPIPGPYILAGHSLGSFNIRLYASQYPQEVVGMIFAEGIHPDQFEQCTLPTEFPGEDPSFSKAREGCKATIEAWSDSINTPEGLDYFTSAEQVKKTGPFGDLPLTVLVAETNLQGAPGTADEFMAKLVSEEQHELAALSTRSEYIVVPYASHADIVTRQATIDAIIQMVQSLQGE